MTSASNKFLLARREKVIQVLLCKSKGNFNIKNLRIIQLIEADLSICMRLIWVKKLVSNIINAEQFLQEQFGSKYVSLGISAAVLRVIT